MRLATWNINGLRARAQYLEHYLRAEQPDVIGLQELKMEDDAFPHATFEALGYHAAALGQKGWNGVAVLSKEPIEVIKAGLEGEFEAGSRFLSVETAGIRFITVYCPNGKSVEHADFAGKLRWFESLAKHLESEEDPSRPLAIAGDFNIVPAAIDSWSEETLVGRIFHTVQERKRLTRLLDWGLVDLWRQLRPDDPGHSWWDYRAGAFHKRQGLRIDLILATDPLAQRASSAHLERTWRKKVEGLTPSDHAPVWFDLEI